MVTEKGAAGKLAGMPLGRRFWRRQAQEHGAGRAGRGAACWAERRLRLRAWTRRTATRCMPAFAERRKAGTETGKALEPGGGYGTLKKRQDTESWRDAFLEQQAALQAQTLAQERAQAEGVGAAYTKYVSAFAGAGGSGPGSEPAFPAASRGTGLAQAIETSNANYERNKTHDISGRPVHGQGVDAAGEFAYGNSQMKGQRVRRDRDL